MQTGSLGGEDQPIVIEIHALNDKLTEDIRGRKIPHLYRSMTTLNIDDNNQIPVSDLRLVRRIARDIRSGKDRQSDAERMGESAGRRSKKYFPLQRRGGCLF